MLFPSLFYNHVFDKSQFAMSARYHPGILVKPKPAVILFFLMKIGMSDCRNG